MNKVIISGNLAADPEIRNIQGNRSVANFRIAQTEKYKDSNGEKKEKTEWISCVCWQEGLCGVIENYVRKGDKVLIEGKFTTRMWEKDGEKRYATEVLVNSLEMLGSPRGKSEDRDDDRSDRRDSRGDDRRNDHGSDRGRSQAPSRRQVSNDMDDEIPF